MPILLFPILKNGFSLSGAPTDAAVDSMNLIYQHRNFARFERDLTGVARALPSGIHTTVQEFET